MLVKSWNVFFTAELTAAAAFAGLLFVSLSVNQKRILPIVPDRATTVPPPSRGVRARMPYRAANTVCLDPARVHNNLCEIGKGWHLPTYLLKATNTPSPWPLT